MAVCRGFVYGSALRGCLEEKKVISRKGETNHSFLDLGGSLS